MSNLDMQRFTQFAVDNLGDAAYWIEIDGRIIYVNDAASRMTGYSKQELLGLRIHDLNPAVTEEMWATLWDLLKRAGRRTFEGQHRAKDGRLIPVEISANLFVYEGKEYSCAFTRDTSERKALEARLRHAEKMEAIGRLAGGVAHDFNNQLSGIMGYAELIRDGATPDSEQRELADRVIRFAERSADLTSQLLAFARKGKYSSEPVDLHGLVEEVVAMLKRSVDKRIEIATELAASTAVMQGDSSQLQNAILNLGINACDAMPEGGRLAFASEVVALDESFGAAQSFEMEPGDYVRLTVSDTGTGMDDETLERAFEPFFTSKETGKGTGLGLPAVYGTMKNHHGAIVLDSELGAGTRALMYLPVASKEARDAAANATPRTTAASSSVRVLVVDDEAPVREVLEKMLERSGHAVTTCQHGREAVEIVERSPDAFDLVILDHAMPVMAGPETLAALRVINPSLRVLLASAYGSDEDPLALAARGVRGVLRKPFTRASLLATIDDAMADRSGG